MDSFEQADVKRLSAAGGKWCVSLFLPTHRAGGHVQQDSIRFKNMLRDAERQMLAAGTRTPDAAALLQPASALLGDSDFWRYQSDGLAVFVAPGEFQCYRVPLPFAESAIVADRLHVKPLLPLLTGDGHFYILGLSQNKTRLLEATRHSVDEIALEGVPASLQEALGVEVYERQLQFHTRAPERGGRRAAVFHGHGPGHEQSKDQLERFFRQIDAPLCDFLRSDRAPLVLAGVDYYFPIYRSVSRYAQLVEGGVSGNPETMRPEELHGRAWPLVEPGFARDREAALARYRQQVAAGHTSDNIVEIVPAANQGRIDVLFVATDRQQWGTFSRETQEVSLAETATAHNEDLLDRAAVEAWLTGAVVYAMPSQSLPDGTVAAAVYRF